ncbi:hypothetical protein BGX28_006667 [Mortierella sp. GBA30]|nr:hypothetical protein BGX28_006667 [Mortierella sp. GBA30]
MFASIVGLLHQPSIAIRVPHDDTTFNPKEYPNVTFLAQGKVQGKIRLVHSAEDDSGLGMVSSRIWVTKENDKDEVSIRTSFENSTLTFTLEGPTKFGSFNCYHETTIYIPRIFSTMGNLRIDANNTSFSGEALDNLTWNNITADLSNSNIAIQPLQADVIALHTSNSGISGSFDAGHISLNTSNGSISAKLRVHQALDGRQSIVTTRTSNASINLHVDAYPAVNGMFMDIVTKNGKLVVGTIVGPALQSSTINATTANSKIEFNLDASQTGQNMDVTTKTSNASIVSSIMVPKHQTFRGHAHSSNGSITVNLTEDFQGRFDLDTSNSSATVEGSELHFELEKTNTKRGTRGQGTSEIKIDKVSLPGPSQPTPVTVFKHLVTGMRFVFVAIPGPQATATIIVPTVVKDSRGLPHTLEHQDYTGYTIATAGRDGMAEILPVFLDHVLHPTLRDDQYVTEVYHVDGEGKQQGVVFSEMASRENSEADLLDLGLRRLLYPKSQTYYYECGGLTPEIPKMTNDDIREYHKKFYHPSNMTIVVAGDGLQPGRIFDTLIQQKILDSNSNSDVFHSKDPFDIIQEMDISKGREDAPIMSKETKLTSRTIHFPSADEDVGSIGYGWLGPNTFDVRSMVALDILFRLLHETSASPFSQAFVERRNPIASHVDFDVKGCIDTSLLLLFSGVPVRSRRKGSKNDRQDSKTDGTGTEDESERDDEDDSADDVDEGSEDEEQEESENDDEEDEVDEKDMQGSEDNDDDAEEAQDLFEPGFYHQQVLKVLTEFVEGGLSDPTEMSRIIARHRTKINESIEDDPHEAATSYLVPDILAHAYLEKDKKKAASIGTRSNIFEIIDELETMEPQFWRDLARTWLVGPSMVEVFMVPDSRLGKVIKATVSEKQKELVGSFGEHGLAKQGVMVTEAVEANKVNMTPEIIATMPPIPDASKVPTIPISAHYVTADGAEGDSRPFKVVQVVETNTFFTHVKLCLPLTHLDEDLRPYLVLFQELIFQSSCAVPKFVGKEGSEEIIFDHLDYQSVVTLVSNTLVSHEAAVGFGNDIFACSWLSELFVLACSAERSKFKEQCQLLLRVLMFTEFTEDRILTVAKNLVTQIMELKRDGADMLAMVSTRMTTPVRGYELSTGYCRKMNTAPRLKAHAAQLESSTPILGNDMAISVFRQEAFLKRIVQELKQKTDHVPKILSKLERIKQAMLQSLSEVMMSSKRNGNTFAAGFAQIGVPIGFGSGVLAATEAVDPVKLLSEVWDQEHTLYEASSGVVLNRSLMATMNSKKRKPSESFHQQQDQPSGRILRNEVEATIRASHLTLDDSSKDKTSDPNGALAQLEPFPFPRTPYRPLMADDMSNAPNSVLIPLKSITSSYLVSIVPCDIVYHPATATEENHLDQYATLLLCEILSRSEGPLYSAIRGQGYAYGCSISVYLWTAQMAFEIRDAMDPVKAYDAFLDIIRMMEMDWEGTVGGQFEIETAMASQAYQTCMERATAGGALSWVLRGAVRGYTSIEELTKCNNYMYRVGVADLKRVYNKYFKQFLNGREGLTTVLLTPPSPPESVKTHFAQYGIDFQEAALQDFEIEPTYDFVSSPSTSSSRIISPGTTAPGSPMSSSSSSS